MEHICENCTNEFYKEKVGIWFVCALGFESFYECQVACTDDYFEPKK